MTGKGCYVICCGGATPPAKPRYRQVDYFPINTCLKAITPWQFDNT